MASLTTAELLDAVSARVGKTPTEFGPVQSDLENWAVDALMWLLPLAPESGLVSVTQTASKTPPFTMPSTYMKVQRVSALDGRLAHYVAPEQFLKLTGSTGTDTVDDGAQEWSAREDSYLPNPSIVKYPGTGGSIYVCRKTHTSDDAYKPGDNAVTWGEYWWGPFANDTTYDTWDTEQSYTGQGLHQGVGGPSHRIWTEIGGTVSVYRKLCPSETFYIHYLAVPAWGDATYKRNDPSGDAATYYLYRMLRPHVCAADNEPGVGDNWEDYWSGPLSEDESYGAWTLGADLTTDPTMEIPVGWEGILADYCAMQFHLREGNVNGVDRMNAIIQQEIRQFGIYTDTPKSVGG